MYPSDRMRLERKYRLEVLHRNAVVQVIRLHPASFRPSFPERQITNLYFDTPDLQTFRDNVSGVASRRKYRLRWYGAGPVRDARPVFEIKSRENQLGYKDSYRLPDFNWEGSGREVLSSAGLPPLPPSLRPVLLNTYCRSYWATPNGRFRITVDWDLRFAGVPQREQWYDPVWSYDLPGIILEVKYPAAADNEAEDIFQYLPFRLTKSSKYVMGINLVMA